LSLKSEESLQAVAEDSQERIAELSARLEEAQETLRAIRSGEVDAFIVHGPTGEQIYTLRNAEQPYRNLVEEMQEGAAILTLDGHITYCNRRLAALLNTALENMIGSCFERFVESGDLAGFTALLTSGCGKRRVRLRAADGRMIDVYLSLSTSRNDGSERRHLLIGDLSELLDARSGRDRAEQESQAKDELMAMLAHELRNPLSAITAAVQVLGATAHESETAVRARSIISRQAQHLSCLVDDLLDVGRVVTGKIPLEKRSLDFGELVRRTVATLGERYSKHTLTISTEPVWIEGDGVRIEQVVTNLVGNALKYTPAGGAICVTVRAEGEEAVLKVADNGLGIPSNLLPRVFDLFVQGERSLDRPQGGLGIGLTLARRLVGLHHGTVSAFSEGPGCGSTFVVRLPRVPSPHEASPPPSSTLSGCAGRRVLLIEDNRDAREMFRTMLELAGHHVLEAEEGVSGLDMLRTSRPDVAVIDVGLPGLDGYEVARRFRADPAGSGVLLVALTGYGTPEARERSRRAGFDHHLTKPVDRETLQRLVCGAGIRPEAHPAARV
jgi:signal transduction histidine kinase/ActR/RegA family two-component response regulator